MLVRNRSHNKEDYSIKYVSIVVEKIPYLPQGAGNVTEKI
jgi:hypothetical protein